MDRVKKGRTPVRTKLTKIINEAAGLLPDSKNNKAQLKVKLEILQETWRLLSELDSDLQAKMAEEDAVPVDEMEKESEEAGAYQEKYVEMRNKLEDVFMEPIIPRGSSPTPSLSSVSVTGGVERRGIKLPQIQLGKFTGELKDWLAFWGQFEKIHEDVDLDGSEKFHYLLQYMVPGTTAFQIVSSYPMTSGNYPKAVEALKTEFGNEDMLLQVYVRELLKLVITNVNARQKIPLESLVLQLDSHLRALETLKLEAADPATWLFPLVESSLPEEILLTWQRSPLSAEVSSQDEGSEDEDAETKAKKTRLDYLMQFLKKEVSIKKRIKLAQSGFQEDSYRKQDKKPKADKVPTLAGFHVTDKDACIFCEKGHQSQDCFTAMRWSLDQKKKMLSDKRACFVCLKVGHPAKNCRAKVMCTSCGRKHYGILCVPISGKDRSQQQSLGMRPESAPVSKGADWTQTKAVTFGEDGAYGSKSILRTNPNTNHFADMSNQVCTSAVKLMTILVDICVEGRKKTVRAFLDSGSQRSYILNSTAEEVGLKSHGTETATHSGFNGMQTPQIQHHRFNATIGRNGGGFQCTMSLRGVNKICNPIPRIPRDKQLFQQLKDNHIFVNDVEDGSQEIPKIEVLIGVDYFGRLQTGKVIQLGGGLSAFETKLGWVLAGEQEQASTKSSHEDTMGMVVMSMAMLESQLEDMWKLETIGITDDSTSKTTAIREQEAKDQFVKTIARKEDGRYSVKLPFIEDHPKLPSNRQIALRRLERETDKLTVKGKFEAYDCLLKEWSGEFTEVVPKGDVDATSYFIPHRPVFKDSLTTPVRPVFDCSCKVGKSPSLNDCLQKGCNYIQLIPELLLRFREKKIGVTADIRKAFQMIEVAPEDRKYLRFLWWEDYGKRKLVEYQHTRVVFGATCSPFILGAVLEHHLTNVPPPGDEVAKKLLDNFYVDNYLNSEDTLEEYHSFREKSTKLLSDAKMELRMWMSNVDELDDENTIITSILGIKWDRKADHLFVVTEHIKKPEVVTRRVLLSTIQKIFDPLVFLSPALLPMKLILQQSWVNQKKWDEPLPYDEGKAFGKWFDQVNLLQEIKVPRIVTAGIQDKSQWSIHVFCDASAASYACIIFLRVETEDDVSVQMVMSKSRVSPVKVTSIPRLELLGCLIGTRMAATVKKALNLADIQEYFWSDSTTAIAWIKRELNHDIFVRNRVKEIRSKSNREDLRHVPGVMNPADLPSRGCPPAELLESRWWEGPEWLKLPKESWPSVSDEDDEEAIMAEVKKGQSVSTAFFMDGKIRDFTLAQTVRIMGWVKRAVHNFKNPKEKNLRIMLSLKEDQQAELAVWKDVQDDSFPNLDDLKGFELVRCKNGVLRKKTRLLFREDVVDFRMPIILPSKHQLVQKLIMDTHIHNCHAGVNFLLSHLRERFWILQGRRTIKGVISKCVHCRRYAAKPTVVEEAPLPEDRIKDAEPFEVTGIDLAGPLYLKNQQKVWIVLYTCAVYRAVYLDFVTSLSTAAFNKSMAKFVEKNGRPAIVYSDNGTNFVGANNEFKKLDWEAIGKADGVKPIKWKFNPPGAPWWGGWWERLIRTVKDMLRKTLGNSIVYQGELMLLLHKIAFVMNNRPLMHVSEDPSDLEPLTPAMFLKVPIERCFPEAEATEKSRLQVRHQHLQSLKEELKRRFRSEYLGQLVSSSKKKTRELKLGELVFIRDEQRKRLDWLLGRILEFLPGKDGVNRLARVKTPEKVMLVAVQRLHPLELDCKLPAAMKTRSGRTVKAPQRLGTEGGKS